MIDKATQKQILANMDEAAEQAKVDFNGLPEEVKRLAAAWIKKWYLKAGYKRLGRFLVKYAKDIEKQEKGD
ncbi:hypothetical protein JXB22_04110 [candidate division WOR-3 bacterium]|nr:hypothetical protein [candidate division WOR-3 bacterium]